MTRSWELVSKCAAFLVAGCGTPPPPSDVSHQHEESRHHQQGDGHHQGHRFEDPEEWARRFEDPERDSWQRPDVVIQALDLTPRSSVADIGAATGYFPIRLSAVVSDGRVWGIDIEPGMVRYLNERARREGLRNLFAILGTPDDPLIPEPVDAILVVNTYHHIQERTAYFGRLSSLITEGGRLVIVDYKQGDLPHGPPEAMRIPPEIVQQELEAAGYSLSTSDLESLPYQYVLVFEPTPEHEIGQPSTPVTAAGVEESE